MPGVMRFLIRNRMKNLALLVLTLVGVVLLSSCLDLGSDTSRDVGVIANSPSPSQSYTATSYRMSGGGAAGWCYVYVNMRKQSEEFNPDSGIVFGTQCTVEPELKWKDEKSLTIVYPRDSNIYTQEKAWGAGESIAVSYVPK